METMENRNGRRSSDVQMNDRDNDACTHYDESHKNNGDGRTATNLDEYDADLYDEAMAEIEEELYASYMEDGLPFLNKYFARCEGNGWITLLAKNGPTGDVATHWFNVAESFALERMEDLGINYTSRKYDVYFSTCLSDRQPDDCDEENVVALVPALFLDIDTHMDPAKEGKCLPHDPTEAFEVLGNLPYRPSMMVASGHGVHAYWLLSKPIRIKDKKHLDDVKQFMHEFALMVADKLGYSDLDVSTCDPSRALRLPRTTNWKWSPYEAVDEYPNFDPRHYDEKTLRRLCAEAATGRLTRKAKEERDYFTKDMEAKNMSHIENSSEIPAQKEGLSSHNSDLMDLSDPSELGTAKRFEKLYSKELVCTQEVGWMHWNGVSWEKDANSIAKKMMISMCDDCYVQALTMRASDTRSAITQADLKNAEKMRSNRHINGALDLAETLMAARLSDFDSDPFLLNTPEGVIDLRNGVISPPSPDKKFAHCTNVGLSGPSDGQFQKFIQMATGGDRQLEKYLQLVAGKAAIGRVSQENLVIAYGSGSNGKSTFFNAIQKVFGSYSTTVSPEILQTLHDRSEKTGLHPLVGARCVLSCEIDEWKGISPAKMKRLTSTDRIEGRELYRNSYTFDPSHTLILITNYLPTLGSLDHGTWRRVQVVPFVAQIDHVDAIMNYADVLVAKDGAGILRFIVDGAREFYKDGCKIPDEKIPDCVKSATADYRKSQNWVGNFLEDCCIISNDTDDKVLSHRLYKAYRLWANDNGEKPRPQNQFSPALLHEGRLKKDKTREGHIWLGVKLNDHINDRLDETPNS